MLQCLTSASMKSCLHVKFPFSAKRREELLQPCLFWDFSHFMTHPKQHIKFSEKVKYSVGAEWSMGKVPGSYFGGELHWNPLAYPLVGYAKMKTSVWPFLCSPSFYFLLCYMQIDLAKPASWVLVSSSCFPVRDPQPNEVWKTGKRKQMIMFENGN